MTIGSPTASRWTSAPVVDGRSPHVPARPAHRRPRRRPGRAGLLKSDSSPKRVAHPFRLLLRDAKGEESIAEADIVLDCTGTYGQPRWLGAGGIPAVGEAAARPHVAGGLEDVLGKDRAKYTGKTVLVVGAGYTAATHVCRLADLAERHPEMW